MDLIAQINNLKNNSSVREQIEKRMEEFKKVQGSNKLFNEMCFCLLTANYNAKGAIKIQNELNDKFAVLPEKQLAQKLGELGHRFPNARANYIACARDHKEFLSKLGKTNDPRHWLVDNIKGLGMKESSHFLRNTGHEDYAIIDFHIIDLLVKNKLIERPKTLTEKKYLEIEHILRDIANKTDLSLAELDMYLWYLETGSILK